MAHVRCPGHRAGELPVRLGPRDPDVAAAELPDGDAGRARVGTGPDRRHRGRCGGFREAGGRRARRRPRTATTGRGRWLRRDGSALECGGARDRRRGRSACCEPAPGLRVGIRGPSRNAILADVVHPVRVWARLRVRTRGRQPRRDRRAAAGADVGVAWSACVRAILSSIVPGLLAALAMLLAAPARSEGTKQERKPISFQVRPVLRAGMRRLFVGMGAFEFGNCAATLLILRATELLQPGRGRTRPRRSACCSTWLQRWRPRWRASPRATWATDVAPRLTLLVGRRGVPCARTCCSRRVGASVPVLAARVRARRASGSGSPRPGRQPRWRLGRRKRCAVRRSGCWPAMQSAGNLLGERDRGGAVDGRVADGARSRGSPPGWLWRWSRS